MSSCIDISYTKIVSIYNDYSHTKLYLITYIHRLNTFVQNVLTYVTGEQKNSQPLNNSGDLDKSKNIKNGLGITLAYISRG